jgi:ketosteroid isomerase-like protein
MKKCMFIFMFGAMLGFAGCESKSETVEVSHFSLDSVKSAIAASNGAFGQIWAAGDSTAYADCYTSDAQLYVPNMERMTGKGAAMAFFNGGLAWGIRGGSLTTEEVIGGPDVVGETGKYVITDSAGKAMDKGKYIVLWKQENGKWKMHRDIWNSDNPMPAANPAK